MIQDRPFVSAKPLGLGVVREMPALLAEFSGPQIVESVWSLVEGLRQCPPCF